MPPRGTTSKFFQKKQQRDSSSEEESSEASEEEEIKTRVTRSKTKPSTSKKASSSTSNKKKKPIDEDDEDFEVLSFSEEDTSSEEEYKVAKKKNTKAKATTKTKGSQSKSTRTTKRKKKEESDSSEGEEEEEQQKKKKKKTTKSNPNGPKLTEKQREEMNQIIKKIGESKKLFIGCHVSYGSKGVETAPIAAYETGCYGGFAFFLGNQKTYSQKEYTDKMVSTFIENCKKYNYDPKNLLPHASYLINLANPDQTKLEKSKTLFLSEYQKCERLGAVRYNFHPGSTVGATTLEAGCKQIAECINWANEQTVGVCSVLECTAGGGHSIGHKFEHLKMIIDHVEDKNRVGVCLDTCHMFAAGYDLRTQEGCEKVFNEFDEIVGFKYLKGMHLNDSKVKLGTKKDRHENLGKGHLGIEVFKYIVNNENFRNIPMVLETPEGLYADEIQELYSYYNEKEVKPESTIDE
ncbi:endonuclease [Naegleria gruberi]|uniref:Endonuclease n=1 Tax=Naegleria gruberi TaxID=5762 RepID=D2VNP8_NAEGR|nr:endonuclease [Naegleria gruberi]EFC41445.1 endonuclease [Naegleria gruberi]|eukprot:XP_002674189.1 endonuclease [Naegleria gruberi]